MIGLRWLARVGPASDGAWGLAMGWGRAATYRHAARLIDAGWTGAQAMTRGEGRLLYATRSGVAVSKTRAVALNAAPAPTTWAHWDACGWVAAWLTCRGRHVIGARELLVDEGWQGQLRWRERGAVKTRGHRPDLLAAMRADGPMMAVEVELATKSANRLQAILTLHASWINTGRVAAVVYVCDGEHLGDRVREHAAAVGLSEERRTLRVDQLDAIKLAAMDTGGHQPVSSRSFA